MKMQSVVLGLIAALGVAACTGQGISGKMSDATASQTTVSSGMRACLMAQAANKIQDNTLFTDGVTATAKEITATCLQKLSLQSAGIEDETLTLSQSILTTLAQSATAGTTETK